MEKRSLLLSVLLLCLPSYLVHAQAFKTKTGHAEFHSNVPLHSFTGSSEHLVGRISLADSTVDFYLDLNTLDTGIDMRDKDMRQTLETEKHPFADFYGKLISDFDTTISSPQDVTVRGEFGIHGVKKQVEIDGILQYTDEGLEVKADWTLNLKDYNIKPPGILFYRVDEEQDIKIEALLTPTEID